MRTRIPDGLMYVKGQDALTRARERMVNDQEQAMTSKRINRPSDDPVGSMRAIGLKAENKRDEQVSMNLEVANSFLGLADASLGELIEVLSRTKELAIQMGSTSNMSEEARDAVSKEVEQLNLRAVQIGNTRLGDRYIYAGFQTDRAPFNENGDYFGDEGKMKLEIGRGQTVALNIPGMVPFFGVDEISEESQKMREDPRQDGIPTIGGELRNPAAIEASNKGIDPDDKEAFAQIEKKNGVNIFATMKEFSAGLKTNDRTLVQNSIENLDRAFKQVLSARAVVGSRQNIVSVSQDSLAFAKTNNATVLSQTEDADVMKVYTDLSKNENVLKASLEMNKRILTPSLLDFLK